MSHSKPTFPTSSFDPFFSPRSVAVIGASSRPEAVGNAVLRNLLNTGYHGPGEGQRSAGFPGPVYAVNPKGGEIFGEAVYPSLEVLPEVPAIEELDVNPLVITERGLVAIDARVIVGEEGSEED
ncbi:MAG: CoA-binding protein [Acidobacteriota bacterium]